MEPLDSIPASTPHRAARRWTLRAPSRVHFGLLSFGGESERRFGGVGVMIGDPGIECEWEEWDRFATAGEHAERAANAARAWSAFHASPLPRARVTVVRAPPEHVGLGVGTQLSLSIAAGLHRWRNEPIPPPGILARSVGRGLRSAVGVHGFLEGGLIAERGRAAGDDLSPLDCRLDLPESWRILLLRPIGVSGLSGEAEREAFRVMPAVSADVTGRLIDEARMRMIPAAARGDFDAFSAGVYAYGRTAGGCFAAVQGGPYNGERIARLVSTIRAMGISGVGQTSWGPTVFAWLPDPRTAELAAQELRASDPEGPLDIQVARVDNLGAAIDVGPSGAPCGSRTTCPRAARLIREHHPAAQADTLGPRPEP